MCIWLIEGWYLHIKSVANFDDAVASCGDVSEFAVVELDGVFDIWRPTLEQARTKPIIWEEITH